MNEDLTKKLPKTDSEKLALILTTVQGLDTRTTQLGERVDKIETRMANIEGRLETLEGRLETLETQGDRINSRLTSLEQKVDARLHDTRPIWEKVVADIGQLQKSQTQFQDAQVQLRQGQAQLQEGQQRLEESQEVLRGESREIKTFLRDIFRRLSIFNDTMVTIQADYRDIYDRVRGLELNRN